VPYRLARDAHLVRFPAADGVSLEGRLRVAARHRAVVLCHPHPLYGGSMLAPVVLTAEQAFQAAGYTTLAFNFRGTGGSAGTHDEGRAETGDVAGALALLAETLGGPVATQAVAGYSFGSWVGGRVAAADPRVTWYLGIAPTCDLHDLGFLRSARCRVALIGARRDQYCAAGRLEALAASLTPPAWLRLVDADHFFGGALDDCASACAAAIAASEPAGS
jgi:alpha/beta superfamily hydrolase